MGARPEQSREGNQNRTTKAIKNSEEKRRRGD
jgi:hypothetical protein